MSEKMPAIGGQEPIHLDKASAELQLEAIRQSLEEQAAAASSTEYNQANVREEIEKYALPSEKYQFSPEQAPPSSDSIPPVQAPSSYQSDLESIQKQLPAQQKAFSKVVHAPAVEAISSGLEKTVARPSVLLGAFFSVTLGGGLIYLIAQRNGYLIDTQYMMYILLIGGGIAGLVVELLRELKKRFFN